MANLDDINRNILQELERDGRISNLELAEKVGLSPSACLRRVQELERKNIISGYRAVINREVLGSGMTVYATVSLSTHQKSDMEEFEKAVKYVPEIRECHKVTGTIEYILRIEVSDLESYKRFHTEILSAAPKVRSIVTHIVMESPKDERA